MTINRPKFNRLCLPAACWIGLLVCCARAEGPAAVPVDGQPFAARLAAVDRQWKISFDTGAPEARRIDAADLVCWGKCAEVGRGPIVVMADGGLLTGDVLKSDKETLSVDSPLFGVLKLPLERLSGVVFQLPGGRRDRDLLLDRVARSGGDSDRLLLCNGDRVSGLIEAVEDDAVQLATEAGPLKIETDRVAALVFNPTLRLAAEAKGLRAWVGFGDGSLLAASELAVDKSSVRLTTAGQTWKTWPSELVWLQPIGGRATYLSDLKAAGYRHVPYLELAWPYKTDRNVAGGRLRCDGRLYLKGLGMHSAARLTYLLDKPYGRFQAELGVDDSAAGGSVRFRVYVDGRQKYSGQTVRGGRAVVPVSVDLENAKRLDLIVDYADGADVLDHANWINARVVE